MKTERGKFLRENNFSPSDSGMDVILTSDAEKLSRIAYCEGQINVIEVVINQSHLLKNPILIDGYREALSDIKKMLNNLVNKS